MGVSNSGKQIHRLTSVSKDVKPSVSGFERLCATENKKADVAEHPKVFGHVGLLGNEPPGRTELLFI